MYIEQENGWTQSPCCRLGGDKNPLLLPAYEPRTIQTTAALLPYQLRYPVSPSYGLQTKKSGFNKMVKCLRMLRKLGNSSVMRWWGGPVKQCVSSQCIGSASCATPRAHLHLTETPLLGDSSPGDKAMLATPLPRSRLELLPSLSLWGTKTQSLMEWCWDLRDEGL